MITESLNKFETKFYFLTTEGNPIALFKIC